MGCRCCRMIKSYIYDPSAPVDVMKRDPAGNSLYQPHHLPGEGDHYTNKQKQGFHNMGFSNSNSKHNDGTLKLEMDNNQINRLHTAQANPEREQGRQGKPRPGEGSLYILQPEGPGQRWGGPDKSPSQVPIYPSPPCLDHSNYQTQSPSDHPEKLQGSGDGNQGSKMIRNASDPSIGDEGCGVSMDEVDEGVGGTPEYPCDTGDEESILSGDIHTSTTSLSSADTKDDRRAPDASTLESGISGTKSEDEEEEHGVDDDVQSVTDSMVAEALAALEAATAGEDYE